MDYRNRENRRCRNNNRDNRLITGKGNRQLLIIAAATALAVAIPCTGAYYESSVSKSVNNIEVAGLSLGSEHVVEADFSDMYNRILPLSEGDSFIISFSSEYEGDMDVFIMPVLEAIDKTFSEGDCIVIKEIGENDEVISIKEINAPGKTVLCGDPILHSSEEKLEYRYEIIVERLVSDTPPDIDFEFYIALSQKNGNEEFVAEKGCTDNGKSELYSEIKKSDSKEPSELIGFCVLTGTDEIYETFSGGYGKEPVKVYSVNINPVFEPGNPEETEIKWFADGHLVEEDCIDDEYAGLELQLTEFNDGLTIRYEIGNEAGKVVSGNFVFTINGENLTVEEET